MSWVSLGFLVTYRWVEVLNFQLLLQSGHCGTLLKPWHGIMTHLSFYQLLLFFRLWWGISVGGRDRGPEGTGRGEEETDCYITKQTLAHEEETRSAQVKTRTNTSAHILQLIISFCGVFLYACFILALCLSLICFMALSNANHHSCHVHVMLNTLY